MAEREDEEAGGRRLRWGRFFAGAGGIGTLLLAGVGAYELMTRDVPSLVARCQALPARASLDPLVMGLLKSTEEAYGKTAKQVDKPQDVASEWERRSALRELESSSAWRRDGYVACEISNQGSKLARDVRLNVEQSVTFYDGSELSKGTELKLGDMRPATHKDIEYFSGALSLISVFRPNVNLSHADGVGKVSFGVTSYGWIGSFSDMLSTFYNEPILLAGLLLILIPILLVARPFVNRFAYWVDARFRSADAHENKPQPRKRRH